MTIRKGEEWGIRIPTPTSVRIVNSDADLSKCSRSDFVSLCSGDIHQTLGSPSLVKSEGECTLLPIDALYVVVLLLDGSSQNFTAASRIEINSFLSLFSRKRYVCVTNSGIVKGRNLTPRAHPNDGRFDVIAIDPSMSHRNRLLAHKKAATGTHLPHPQISVRQVDTFNSKKVGREERLAIDGITIADWTEISVTILPDYWQVVV